MFNSPLALGALVARILKRRQGGGAAADLGLTDPNVTAGGLKPTMPVGQAANASVTLGLGQGGDNLQSQLNEQIAERRKRKALVPGNQAQYAGSASSAVFGG